jgi:dipeptidyl aminopeptidase/acylaminoacyl peptidase
MRADGTDKNEVLPCCSGDAWAPAWSPDGKRIAFVAYVGNVAVVGDAPLMQLRTVEIKTGRVSKLHVHSLTDGNGPQWVSDGQILINRYN